MSNTEYTDEQVESWKTDMEENGDQDADIYFHEDEDGDEN